jgi:two-component system, chemotaxis family, chemotaxis protein CheY
MILVVDDHDDTRVLLIKLLKLSGYEAVGVSDGNHALLYLKTHRPKLVVLDCHMPCLDGFGVLRAIRMDAALAHLPVLMFSADPSAEDAALRHGAQGFILKGSLDWARLSAAIARHAGSGGEHARPSAANSHPFQLKVDATFQDPDS